MSSLKELTILDFSIFFWSIEKTQMVRKIKKEKRKIDGIDRDLVTKLLVFGKTQRFVL